MKNRKSKTLGDFIVRIVRIVHNHDSKRLTKSRCRPHIVRFIVRRGSESENARHNADDADDSGRQLKKLSSASIDMKTNRLRQMRTMRTIKSPFFFLREVEIEPGILPFAVRRGEEPANKVGGKLGEGMGER